ncbi:MAG: RNA polymerase sigma factor (sigma-70 family) [Phycisphaerales bacterium]|jgi:RNA polymerase sigma factor (sigma-70 family)
MPSEPANEITDAQLVSRCLQGNARAWSDLVDRYSRLVYSIPARHGLPKEEAEDVFQNVWTLAVRHLNALRDGQTVAAWLITTTQRETWHALRKRPPSAVSREAEAEAEIGTHAEFELTEQRQVLRESLNLLDPRCRSLLIALFADERPAYDQIADQLDMPRGAIGPSRARCLDRLRMLFEQAQADEDRGSE